MAIYTVWFLFTQMKISQFGNDASFLIYVWVFIGCYCCAMGFVAVQSSYMFVSAIYGDLRSE